jgi:hypothetical protein
MKNYIFFAALLFSVFALTSGSRDNDSIDDTRIDLNSSKVTLYTGSNTSGKINLLDLSPMNNISSKSFQSSTSDTDALRYDPITGRLFEASRSAHNVLVFENINNSASGSPLALSLRSDVEVENARDIFLSGDKIIVSADAVGPRNTNKFSVYETTGGALQLVNIFETGYQHWGIFLLGNTLYAGMANSNSIAVYKNFFSKKSGTLTADDIFFVEGAKSLRGITYDEAEDKLFLADVVNPLDDSDGAIHTIKNFLVVYSGIGRFGEIKAVDVKTVSCFNSMLGNPVDLEYDNTGKVLYVADRSATGGMALGFKGSTDGGYKLPLIQKPVSGTSSIHLNVE